MSVLSQFLRNCGGSTGTQEDLMAYVVIAGGGGGGGDGTVIGGLTNTAGAGGGAGMVIQVFLPLSFNTTYPIVVGAGGVRGNSGASSTGGNSSFGALTAFGGGGGGNGYYTSLDNYTHIGYGGANAGGIGGYQSAVAGRLALAEYYYSNQINPYGRLSEDAGATSNTSFTTGGGLAMAAYQPHVLFNATVGAGNPGGSPGNASTGGGGGAGAGTYPIDGRGFNTTNSINNGGDGGYGAYLRFLSKVNISSSVLVAGTSGYTITPYQIGGGGGGGARNKDNGIAGAGGGNGGDEDINAESAPANRAGGGGGGSGALDPATTTAGGNGGSGVVMIAYPSSYGAATTTGTVVQDTSMKPGYRIYRFNSSGTFYLPG